MDKRRTRAIGISIIVAALLPWLTVPSASAQQRQPRSDAQARERLAKELETLRSRITSADDAKNVLPSLQSLRDKAAQQFSKQDLLLAQIDVLLGHLHIANSDARAALEYYERVAALETSDPNLTFQAGLNAVAARCLLGKWDHGPNIALLVRAKRENADHYRAAQYWVIYEYGGFRVADVRRRLRESAIDEQAAYDEIHADADMLERALLRAQIEPGIAALAWLQVATIAHDLQRFDQLAELLNEVQSAVSNDAAHPIFEAVYWNQLGLLKSEQHDFAAAMDASTRAARLAKESQQAVLLAIAENNLGQLSLRMGDYEAATQHLDSAANEYQQLQNSGNPFFIAHIKTLVNYAKAMEGDFGYTEAQEKIQAAIALLKQSPDHTDFDECLCFNALGANLYGQGKFQEAREKFERARAVATASTAIAPLHLAEIDVNCAWVCLEEGRPSEAAQLFSRALDTMRKHYGDEHLRSVEMEYYLARAEALLGKSETARQRLQGALEKRERFVDRMIQASLSERDRFALVQEFRVHCESIAWPGALDTWLELGPELNIPEREQYEHVLFWKGLLTRRQTSQFTQTHSRADVQEQLTQRRQILDELRSTYFLMDQVSIRRRGSYRERIRQLEENLASVERTLRTLDPNTFGSASERPTVEEIIGRLPKDSALVDVIKIRVFHRRSSGEAAITNEHYLAFVVQPDGSITRVDLGVATEVENAIQNLLAAYEAQAEILTPEARELAKCIRKPIETAAPAADLLLISADGLLHRVPFSSLPSNDGEPWIERASIVSLPGVSALIDTSSVQNDTPARLCILGNIDFGSAAEPLPATTEELSAVTKIFQATFPQGHVVPLQKREAQRRSVIDALQQARFVHLATHGTSPREEGFTAPGIVALLDSQLILSQPSDDDPAEQFLTAEDVRDLSLDNTQLVVLSACESGLGYVAAGQGVLGLASAFQQAGARDVLCSLWKVDDEATLELMKLFYEAHWKDGLPAARALRTAQQRMRRIDGGKWKHPRNWSAFFLLGGAV